MMSLLHYPQTIKTFIIIKTGNIPNVDLLAIFDNNIDKICSLLSDSFLIEINISEIIVHA